MSLRRPVPPIVVVDDDLDHAIIARTVLSALAPEAPVSVLTDPRRISERLVEVDRGALVLIDRVLDLMESYPLIRDLRAMRPDVRVVMLSAALSPEDGRRALEAGAVFAAEKPGGLEAWKTLLAGILERVVMDEEEDGAVA